MLDINLVTIGSLKDKFLQVLATEYIKRLRPFARLKIQELNPTPFSDSNREEVKKRESQDLMSFLDKRFLGDDKNKIFLLAERGRLFNSQEFANFLNKDGSFVFVLGGALGFSSDLYQRYKQISLSPLTFPHDLARIVFLEQIYRASTILGSKTYHY